MNVLVLLFVLHVSPLASAKGAVRQSCLRYEPDTVAITGTLARHTFYGAPGFGEDPAHDAKEIGYYLDLSRAVCTTTGRDADANPAKHDVRRIQLVLDSAGFARLRPSLGKTVTLRGTLFASFTGHHHAPLLLTPVRSESLP